MQSGSRQPRSGRWCPQCGGRPSIAGPSLLCRVCLARGRAHCSLTIRSSVGRLTTSRVFVRAAVRRAGVCSAVDLGFGRTGNGPGCRSLRAHPRAGGANCGERQRFHMGNWRMPVTFGRGLFCRELLVAASPASVAVAVARGRLAEKLEERIGTGTRLDSSLVFTVPAFSDLEGSMPSPAVSWRRSVGVTWRCRRPWGADLRERRSMPGRTGVSPLVRGSRGRFLDGCLGPRSIPSRAGRPWPRDWRGFTLAAPRP